MPIYQIDGITPVIHPSAYVHPTAVLIGDVIIGPDCYVGPTACLRGDFGRLILEQGANVQDGCVMHGFVGEDTVIEIDGHIGHGAIIHGARVKRNAMVGMNAVVMDGAVVGENSIVAASAFVKAKMIIPPRSLVAGVPGKIMRELSDEEIKWKSDGTAMYHQLTIRSFASMRETQALTEVEANRKRIDIDSILPKHKTKS
jgi:phenylacetic acid degradation protein